MQEAKYSTYEVRVRAAKAVRDGMPLCQVAEAYQVDRTTLYRWCQRYEAAGGNAGLVRKPVSGRPRKLAGLAAEELRAIVLQPASAFDYETDFWTARRLQQVLEREYGLEVSTRTILRRLQEAGLSYQKPEREYFELSDQERQEWVRRELPKIRRTMRKYRAVLYCQDESSLSLTPMLGKTWAPRGATPKQRGTGNRGSISALSAIHSGGQLLFRLHEKRIASAEVIDFLGQLLQHHKRRHVVVVMDQAPPHKSQKTKAYIASQRRLHVFYLPKYSPDWNPDEKVWSHLKQHELKGHQARTKSELLQLAEEKLTKMASNPELLQGIFFRCCVAELLS